MKPRFALKWAFVILASAATTTAMAQGYVGASVGQSDFKVDCSGLTSCDTKDTGYKVFGGYMFMPNFGVELGWADLGKATGSGTFDINGVNVNGTGDLKSRGVFVAAIGVFPFGDASVFGKLGVANLKTKLSVSALGVSDSDSTTSTGVFFGLGAGYEFTRNLGARIEWERYRIKYGDEKDNADLLSIGLVYRF